MVKFMASKKNRVTLLIDTSQWILFGVWGQQGGFPGGDGFQAGILFLCFKLTFNHYFNRRVFKVAI
jgi:hypothetical protein